jgi:UDP-glucose 4-epimerase
MSNILITGGAGYIGSNVANLLIDKGYNVTIIDNLITGNKNLVNKKAKFFNHDISDDVKNSKIFKKLKFDIVMHFAGLISVNESISKPKKYYKFNYEKSKIFFNTCIKNGLKKIIFSSTASVYGNPSKDYVSENDLLNPLNPYAETKLKIEEYLIDKSKHDNISYVILRYFNVAGADEKLRSGLISKNSTHLIKRISEAAVGKRRRMIINGNTYDTNDGTPIRDYIHISDLADIHLISAKYLIKKNKSQIFNCGYGKGYSVKEVIDAFNNILKKKIKFSVGPKRQGDCKMVIANPLKFKRKFNWKPKFNNLEYILRTSYEWEKKINKI